MQDNCIIKIKPTMIACSKANRNHPLISNAVVKSVLMILSKGLVK